MRELDTDFADSGRAVREHAKIGVIDTTPRWRALIPILISAIENGTARGRSNARRSLRSLAREADSACQLQLRTRDALARLVAAWPKNPDELTIEEKQALDEASAVLAVDRRTLMVVHEGQSAGYARRDNRSAGETASRR